MVGGHIRRGTAGWKCQPRRLEVQPLQRRSRSRRWLAEAGSVLEADVEAGRNPHSLKVRVEALLSPPGWAAVERTAACDR